MSCEYFLKTKRLGFSHWQKTDIDLAISLWGEPLVTKYICATGVFTPEEIQGRLQTEISNDEKYSVSYWPFFSLEIGELIGCCGLRPHAEKEYELGFHLKPEYWGCGYATEAAGAIIGYAFTSVRARVLFAGAHPDNIASRNLLQKLGFKYIGDKFYAPTGLNHPSYELDSPEVL